MLAMGAARVGTQQHLHVVSAHSAVYDMLVSVFSWVDDKRVVNRMGCSEREVEPGLPGGWC
jgi:hypothetical protein